MHVRHATPDDAPAVARILVAAIHAAYQSLLPGDALKTLNEQKLAEQWRSYLAPGSPFATLLAESAGEAVGFACDGPHRGGEQPDDRIREIISIHVSPPAWRGGVGRRLLQAALDRMAGNGVREARLWVLERNVRATAFYERAGWRRSGASTSRTWLGVPITVVEYYCVLPQDCARD